MNQLTVYELMGEDMYIWAKYLGNKQIEVRIKDEKEVSVFHETTHLYAWESLVDIAKQILAVDKRIQQEIEITDDN